MGKLIGVSGKKGSGKSTVTAIIRAIDLYYVLGRPNNTLHTFVHSCIIPNTFSSFHNVGQSTFAERQFAGSLKEGVAAIFDIGVFNFESQHFKQLNSPIKKEGGENYTWRELLQLFGTEIGRQINPNFWTDVLFSKFDPERDNWIVSDVRFKNEAEAIKERNGFLIRINRNTESLDNHQSEIDLDNYQGFDVVIDNNGTIDELIEKVHQVMKDYNLI